MAFWTNKQVLVTGGAGLLGSHLCEKLVERGAFVVILDSMRTSKKDNLQNLPKNNYELVIANIISEEAVTQCMKGSSVVFHLAAHMEVKKAVENPRLDYEYNMSGTANALQEALRQKPERFIFASSCGVYGNTEAGYLTEDQANPNNPYGAAKLASEIFGFAYHRCYGLNFTAVRLFSFFGPRLRQTLIHDLAMRLKENPDKLLVLGDGKSVRELDDVENVAEVMMRVAEEPKTIGEVYNYSGGNILSIEEIARLLLTTAGISFRTKLEFSGSTWSGDMRRLTANCKKLDEVIDLPDVISTEVTMRKYLHWLKDNGTDLYSLGN